MLTFYGKLAPFISQFSPGYTKYAVNKKNTKGYKKIKKSLAKTLFPSLPAIIGKTFHKLHSLTKIL